MTKGLEHLEILENLLELFGRFSFDFTVIEKELKVLEIIKNKNVDVRLLKWCWNNNIKDTLNDYNTTYFLDTTLTKEEYELLKEILYEEKSKEKM